MENKKTTPATQQPLTQQHLMAHHVHPDQMYSQQQHPQMTHLSASQTGQIQPNGVMHQLLQSQYHSNMNARSPLLENRHELYGTAHSNDCIRSYGANDNYNHPRPPHGPAGAEPHADHNVNHEPLHDIPKGYNAEVYQDYLKRNPPKDANQIYQNHQPIYAPNVNQYAPKPYLPYSNRIGPQSNTELLRRQYNEIQQMKLQQQLHYQNQAQMHQQQKFAERQMLLQQIHGVQPPPNLQNSIYSDDSYRDLDRYSSKNDFKEYSSPDIHKDVDMYAKDNEYREYEKQNRQYQEPQWQQQGAGDCRELRQPPRRPPDVDKGKSQSPPSNYNHQSKKNSSGLVSPMKSSESSTPSIKSPSSDSRRSSGGNQALRSPVAQRIPSAPVTLSGILYKQGSDGLKVWRKRWFVLSEYCLFYYKSQDEEKLLGSVLLPSYKVSACTAEDKVLRKFSFKLEHANMRTYILAAPDQEAVVTWVTALAMAALMQSPDDQQQRRSERSAARPEDSDEIPTYANAPPKPRRSNEGYNSPSPDAYDPNYDLLKKPASHYSLSTSHARYQDNTNHPASPHQEPTYSHSPQSPPTQQYQQPQHQTRRAYDSQHLSLPLTNTLTDRLQNEPNTPSSHKANPQSPYFDRNRSHQQTLPANTEQVYDVQRNPFLQGMTPQIENQSKENELQNKNFEPRLSSEPERTLPIYDDSNSEGRMNSKQNEEMNAYHRDTIYGELSSRVTRAGSVTNERLIAERRTPDAYGRSTTTCSYSRGQGGDYEDVYGQYATESGYGRTHSKPAGQPRAPDTVSVPGHQHQQYPVVNEQPKIFSGPSVLRRKKMQSSGVQPPMPRPHSADFLEYESKAEMMNKNPPTRSVCDPQPQRPKSSLDINSYYDPSSDRYYSEESYAEKMRQSAQYLQQGLPPRNMDIPLAKYASGLAKKQLSTAYSQITNNNYEAEFSNTDNVSYDSKCADVKGLNSNWTLKEKETQKDYLNRSGSVMSDGSNVSGYVKENNRYDQSVEGFMRSASARLPSAVSDKDGDKKIQQREESMKRLLEWKQRMLQSPLTRKSTPATISLARSLNQSRQSLRSDQFKAKTYTNASYNSYSSDDEASMTMSGNNKESGTNSNSSIQNSTLSRKAFLGSNTSIGRNSRDVNIPVRAVSPRVRWAEDKPTTDHYGSQQMSTSQQNLSALIATEDAWALNKSSRAVPQPIRAVSPRVRRNTETDDMQRRAQQSNQVEQLGDIPTAGELLGRTHEELVLLLIQLRRRHAATHRAIEQCCVQINSIEDCPSSVKLIEREENLQKLENLKMQLMELEHQYEKSKPLVQLVDNMVKLGSLYNRPGSTIERLERNQRLRQKVLAEHAFEQQRWLDSVAAGKPLETEAARARVAELWALEQELADEAAILQGLKTDKDAIDNLLSGVRSEFDSVHKPEVTADADPLAARRAPSSGAGSSLEAELARVQQKLAHNSKKLEQTVAHNARLERELQQLRRALHARRAAPHAPAHTPARATAMLEGEVSRVQQLVGALQRQRQELSRAVRQLTQQSHALQTTHDSMPGKRRPITCWQETNLDTGHTTDYGHSECECEAPPPHADTRGAGPRGAPPQHADELQLAALGNLSNVEKQEIKTVRIVKRESERRQRDRERSLVPMSEWPAGGVAADLDHFLDEELVQPPGHGRAAVSDRHHERIETSYLRPDMELSPKYVSSPSLSNYEYSQNISSLSSSYNKSYDRSGYDRTVSLSSQYLNSPTDSSRTLTNDPLSKTSSIASLTRSHMELSPIFKSEAAKQIITEMSGEPKNGSLHRRQVPKEKRRHNTAPHHLSAKTLNEMPKDPYGQDRAGRSLDDADLERALRGACAPDVVREALPARAHTTIDQLLAAPQKILIPERYIPEKPPELSPEEQQKRQEKVESIKKMLTSSSTDPSQSPDPGEKRQRQHLLQMNQILAKQVTEMSKIIAGTNVEQGSACDH